MNTKPISSSPPATELRTALMAGSSMRAVHSSGPIDPVAPLRAEPCAFRPTWTHDDVDVALAVSSGPKADFALDNVLAERAGLGLLQQAPDLRAHEVELRRLEALAPKAPHVLRLSF